MDITNVILELIFHCFLIYFICVIMTISLTAAIVKSFPSFIFAWYDLWIGIFIDTKKKKIYYFPIPMVGFYFNY